MINAWSLLWEELNGTMDETYPVKKKEYVDGHGDVHPVTDFKVEGVKDPSYYDYNTLKYLNYYILFNRLRQL